MNPSLEALREVEAEMEGWPDITGIEGAAAALWGKHADREVLRYFASRIKAAREALEAEMARLAQLVMENTEP